MGLRRAAARYATNTRLLGVRSSARMLVDDWTIRTTVRKPITRAFPRYMQIEVTTICNLHCTFCPRTTVMVPQKDKPVKHMKIAEFRRIIDELPFLWKTQLQGYGEPLLNPDILEMIRYARSKGIAVQMNTNLTRWPRPGGVEGLVKSGLTDVIVSVDGATPKIFEAGRVGAKFDVVIGNLRELVATRNRLGMKTPMIETATVVMPLNMHEMPQLRALFKEIGVDRSNFQLERSYSGDWVSKAREAFDAVDGATGITFDLGAGGYVETGKPKPPCPWPWRAGYITVDGYVTACCEYPATVAKVHNFGNVLEQPFREIWNGPRYRAFRRKLLNGEAPKVCVGCPAAP